MHLLRNTATVALSALLSACTNVALQAVNLPSYLMSDLRLERGIAYGERADQKLDLYLPIESAQQRRQLVVFIYGGAWTSGSRADYFFVADALTAAGYAVAIPDYIKYPRGAFPAFVDDVAQSIAWLSAHIDRYAPIDEFVLMGHSAGAHTAALLITDPAYFTAQQTEIAPIGAFVGLAGPYGFKPDSRKYQNIFANLDDYNQMRPLHFVTGNEPPMLLLHGSADTTVLPVNTRKFAERVLAGGGSAQAQYYDDAGHIAPVLAMSRLPFANRHMRADILEFLDSRNGGAVGGADQQRAISHSGQVDKTGIGPE